VAGADEQPLLVIVRLGKMLPALAYDTETGADEFDAAGLAPLPKFQTYVEPAAGTDPLTDNVVACPSQMVEGLALIATVGTGFTVMVFDELTVHPPCVMLKPIVFAPALSGIVYSSHFAGAN
jgi:hypothetical protein